MAAVGPGSVSTVQGWLIVVYKCGTGGSTLAWRIGEADAWQASLTLNLAIGGIAAIGVGRLCGQLIVVCFWSSLV